MLYINSFCILWLLIFLRFTLANDAKENDINNDDDDGYTFLISGGERVKSVQKEYAKYIVSIRSRAPKKYFGDNHFCAGTIIGPRLIITAAHCVMDKRKVVTRPRRMLIVAGTPNRLKKINSTVELPVKAIRANQNFILHNKNDIALIYLQVNIPDNNENIKIMPLPTKPPPYETRCMTLGWGRLYYNGPLSASLTHIDVGLHTEKECSKSHPNYLTDLLCASDAKHSNRDPCRGDSGGPLFCNNSLTGIISYTIACGSVSYPSLYTNVYYHLDWIRKHWNAAHATYAKPFLLLVLQFILTILA